MPHAREHMLGLTTRPSTYLRLTQWAFRGIHNRVVADVAAADLVGGSRILDVGTGPGTLPLRLSQLVPRLSIDGIDLSPEMIAFATASARANPQADAVHFTVGDAAHMRYPDASFDLIVSSMSQHHWADVSSVLADIRRVLKPTGRIWIYDARFALGQAAQAAQALFPTAALRRIPARTGFPRLFARLSIEPPS